MLHFWEDYIVPRNLLILEDQENATFLGRLYSARGFTYFGKKNKTKKNNATFLGRLYSAKEFAYFGRLRKGYIFGKIV